MEVEEVKQSVCSILIVLVILFVSTPVWGEDQWASIRKDSGGTASCYWENKENSEIREWHFSRLTKRKYRYGIPVWASPAIAVVEGVPMAFIGGYDQNIHALDLAKKTERWYKITNGPITSSPAIGNVGDLPVVFFGSSDRTVYACLAHDGTKLWTRELVTPSNTMGTALTSSPLLHNGILYITCFSHDKAASRYDQRGWLFALEMQTGRMLWKYEVSQGPVSSPVGVMTEKGYVIYVAARKGKLTAVLAKGTPEELWSYQMPHEVLGSPSLALVENKPILYLGSKFGNLIALNALNGEEVWKRMAGNWIDNTVCCASVDGEQVVFAGSHDYNVYAFKASNGEMLWRKHLGGEVFSAPTFFEVDSTAMVAVAALDNHVYIIDARTGRAITTYFTGNPIWDKISKGDVLWGSPSILVAGENTAAVFGSYSGSVYVLPIYGDCALRAQVRSSASLWIWLGIVCTLFLFVVLPIVLLIPQKRQAM